MSVLIEYTRYHVAAVNDDVLKECANLFSSHYGVWSTNQNNKGVLTAQKLTSGSRVKMSLKQLRKQFLFDDKCGLAIAKKGEITQIIICASNQTNQSIN